MDKVLLRPDDKNQHDDSSFLEFWASHWNITTSELRQIIQELGSSSFLRIDNYFKDRVQIGTAI